MNSMNDKIEKKSNLRVLFITNIPSPYRMEFFDELGRKCDLTVITETEVAHDRNDTWMEKYGEWSFKYHCLSGWHLGNDTAFNPSIIRWLKREKYDIVILGVYSTFTQIFASMVLRLKCIPYVLNADGGFISKDSFLQKSIKSTLIGGASWWLATGQGTREYLLNYGAVKERTYVYPFTSLKRMDILDNAMTNVEKQNIRNSFGINGNLVITVGQFITRKGIDVLLEAWRSLEKPNWHLAIIGEGVDREKYESFIKKYQLKNVHIIKFLKKQELTQWYCAADFFVMPTRYDIWGLVINEAMAKALPVVTTNGALAGRELVLDGENGYVVPVDDPVILTSKMKQIMDNKMLLEQMGMESLNRIKEYTIENMANEHMRIFKTILGIR